MLGLFSRAGTRVCHNSDLISRSTRLTPTSGRVSTTLDYAIGGLVISPTDKLKICMAYLLNELKFKIDHAQLDTLVAQPDGVVMVFEARQKDDRRKLSVQFEGTNDLTKVVHININGIPHIDTAATILSGNGLVRTSIHSGITKGRITTLIRPTWNVIGEAVLNFGMPDYMDEALKSSIDDIVRNNQSQSLHQFGVKGTTFSLASRIDTVDRHLIQPDPQKCQVCYGRDNHKLLNLSTDSTGKYFRVFIEITPVSLNGQISTVIPLNSAQHYIMDEVLKAINNGITVPI